MSYSVHFVRLYISNGNKYSTQATNRHELIFSYSGGGGGGGGICKVLLKNFLRACCSTSQSRFRNDVVTNIRRNWLNSAGIAQEFITKIIHHSIEIHYKIALQHAARKLINYKSVKDTPNAARINRNPRRFARFSLTIVIKKDHTCFGAPVPKCMFLVKQQ